MTTRNHSDRTHISKSISWKKIFRALTAFSIALIISIIIVSVFHISPAAKILDAEFLITFLGVLLGFALTIMPFIISMTDKIREFLEKSAFFTHEQKELKKATIVKINKEIKDNIYLIFTALILITVVHICEKTNLSFFKQFEEWLIRIATKVRDDWYSFQNIINSFKLAIFLLSVYSIYDILATMFKVSNATEYFYEKK